MVRLAHPPGPRVRGAVPSLTRAGIAVSDEVRVRQSARACACGLGFAEDEDLAAARRPGRRHMLIHAGAHAWEQSGANPREALETGVAGVVGHEKG